MATEQLNHTIESAKHLSREELKIVAQRISAMLHNLEWDETLASPESLADSQRMLAKIEADRARGNMQNYLTDEHLEELF